MNIWIIQTGEPMFTDGPNVRPMRAMNLASKAVEAGHEVTVITANFDHFTKVKRFQSDNVVNIEKSLSVFFIDSPGYKRNISPQRFIDHLILGYRMSKFCNKLPMPDSVFIGYPPIETSWFMSKFLKKRNIPYILDVKDAWPTNIVEAFPKKLRPLAQFFLFPYFLMFQFSARNAFKLCSISESFLHWSQNIGKRENIAQDFIAPLTSREIQIQPNDLLIAEEWFSERVKLEKDKKTIYFIGSLSRSFDFDPVMKLAKENKINLIIGGDGEQYEYLHNQTAGLKNVFLLGWVNYAQGQVISMNSDLALAPLKPLPDFEMSVPNKYYDYMRQGKPILSSLSGDSKKLIEDNEIGFYYSSYEDLRHIIENINSKTQNIYEENAKEIYEQKFSYEIVYSNLLKNLLDS